MLPIWEQMENRLKFLGQSEAAQFLHYHPAHADTVQAWIGEIRHGTWRTPTDLAADFRSVEAASPPRAIFRLGHPAIVLETLVDFRNEVVLLTKIRLGVGNPLTSTNEGAR